MMTGEACRSDHWRAAAATAVIFLRLCLASELPVESKLGQVGCIQMCTFAVPIRDLLSLFCVYTMVRVLANEDAVVDIPLTSAWVTHNAVISYPHGRRTTLIHIHRTVDVQMI